MRAAKQEPKHRQTHETRIFFFENASFPFLALIVFSSSYFLCANFLIPPATDIQNGQIMDIFSTYYRFFGAGIALLTLIATYIVYGLLAAVTLMRLRIMKPILLLVSYAPWTMFGFQLMFREVGRVDIARAIIHYVGLPLLISGSFLCLLALAWMVLSVRRTP